MSPELIEPTLHRSGKGSRKEHAPQVEPDVAGSHHRVEGAEVTIRVRSPVVRGYVWDLEPLGGKGIRNMRSERLLLLIRFGIRCSRLPCGQSVVASLVVSLHLIQPGVHLRRNR